ncbi:MAG: hypothetical protein HQL39_13155 [Alphaproteobacteria bacterium]|nr:hypothetical protein [Alphaproteobacteria bacterium]
MAGKSRSDIIRDIEDFMARSGGGGAEWFVSVTDNPKRKLFTDHKVRSEGDGWISRRALDDLQAQQVEEYFRTVRKTVAAPKITGGMDAVFVYAYRRKAHTKP